MPKTQGGARGDNQSSRAPDAVSPAISACGTHRCVGPVEPGTAGIVRQHQPDQRQDMHVAGHLVDEDG